MTEDPGEFDRRAQAWVKNRYGVTPDLGSVEFSTDCAAYASGGWATVDVAWTESGQVRCNALIENAWQADLTMVIRELVATEPLDPTPDNPAA